MEESEYPDHCCPTCGKEPEEFYGRYEKINGKSYPVFSKERKYFNGNNDMHDWDETHYCKKCKQEWAFSTGI